MIKNILFVGLGGFLGSSARYVLSRYLNTHLPYGTFLVNVLGSFLLGWLSFRFLRQTQFSEEFALMITTGFIGAFTTFSTLMVESHVLWEQRHIGATIAYLSLTITAGLIAAYLGIRLAR